jgi:hypothetical protein
MARRMVDSMPSKGGGAECPDDLTALVGDLDGVERSLADLTLRVEALRRAARNMQNALEKKEKELTSLRAHCSTLEVSNIELAECLQARRQWDEQHRDHERQALARATLGSLEGHAERTRGTAEPGAEGLSEPARISSEIPERVAALDGAPSIPAPPDDNGLERSALSRPEGARCQFDETEGLVEITFRLPKAVYAQLQRQVLLAAHSSVEAAAIALIMDGCTKSLAARSFPPDAEPRMPCRLPSDTLP